MRLKSLKFALQQQMMTDEELQNQYKDIFDNLSEYALVKNPGDGHFLFHIKDQGTVMLEENGELKNLFIKRGIKIVDDVKELKNPDFEAYGVTWDEETNSWIKLLQKDAFEYFRKKKEARKKKKE